GTTRPRPRAGTAGSRLRCASGGRYPCRWPMSSSADFTTEDEVHRQHYGLTFAPLALAGCTFALLQSLVAPALPEIQRDLHTTTTAVAWVLTAYLLSASVMTPIIGRLGDMFGKEHTLVASLAVLGAGTLVAALAHPIE